MSSVILSAVSFLVGASVTAVYNRHQRQQLILAKKKISSLRSQNNTLDDMNHILSVENMELEARLNEKVTPLEKLMKK